MEMWKGGGDVTDEEFIPLHRIAWFRLKGEGGRKVWDREMRLDRLFGSGVPADVEDEQVLEDHVKTESDGVVKEDAS